MPYRKRGMVRRYRKRQATKPRRSKAIRRKRTFVKRVMNVVNRYADKKQTSAQTFINLAVGQFVATSATTFSDSGWSLQALTAPGTGTSDSTRTGNRIHLTGCQIRLQAYQQDPTVSLNKQRLRVIVFYAKGGIVPAGTILSDPSYFLKQDSMYGVTSVLSDRNSDYIKDFHVVCDKIYTMPQKQFASNVTPLDVKLNLRLNHDQNFYGTTSATIADHQMYMLLLTDAGNASIATSYTAGTPYFPIGVAKSGLVVVGQSIQYYTDV